MGLAVVLSFVLVTGVTAALTVPAVALSAEKSVPQMLPFNTALYVSADVNPSAGTRSNLANLAHDYTSQTGWSTFGEKFGTEARGSLGQSCFHKTVSKATDHLPYLGHNTSIALITSPFKSRGVRLSRNWQTALARNLVVLAPLEVHMTLIDAVAGFAFSAPKESQHYSGVSIYRETVPTCGLNRQLVPSVYYAAVDKGYIVAALVPDPIKHVIDAAAGRSRSLALNTAYGNLTAQLPADQLGSYYVNPSLLGGRTGLLRKIAATHLLPDAVTFALRHSTLQAGSVTSLPGGLEITDACPTQWSEVAQQPVSGSLATLLPATTQGYASSNGLRSSLQAAVSLLKNQAIAPRPAAAAQLILANVRREIDFLVLGPKDQMPVIDRAPATRLSAAIYWRTPSDKKISRRVMAAIIRRLGDNSALRRGTQGAIGYGVDSLGAGYAVGNGWALVSNSLFRAIDTLQSRPQQSLATLPAYGSLSTPGTTNEAIFYLDVAGRKRIVWKLIHALVPASIHQYEQDIHLILGPVQGVSGTVRVDSKAGVTVTTINAAIPSITP
jgi:Protein of unknown function (DUF3352)